MTKYKILFALCFVILLIGMTTASLGTYRQSSCVQIKTILNSTLVNLSSVSYPNSTIALTNLPMTKVGSTFNYTFCDTSYLGTYVYDYYDEKGNVYVNDFKISVNGDELSVQTSIIYFIFLIGAILVLSFLIFGAVKFPWENNPNAKEDSIIGLNQFKFVKIGFIALSYVLFMFLMGILRGITANYIPEMNIQGFFETIYTIMLSLLLPIIICFFIFAIIIYVNSKKLQKMMKRGLIIE